MSKVRNDSVKAKIRYHVFLLLVSFEWPASTKLYGTEFHNTGLKRFEFGVSSSVAGMKIISPILHQSWCFATVVLNIIGRIHEQAIVLKTQGST